MSLKSLVLSTLLLGCAAAQCPITDIHVGTVQVYVGPDVNLEYWPIVTYTNATTKTITGIKFSTAWLDAVADIHANETSTVSDSITKPGATKKVTFAAQIKTVEKGWLAAPLKVVFSDGTSWQLASSDKECFAQSAPRRGSGAAKVTELPKELLR